MMVIHDENELPVEVADIKKPLFEQESFNAGENFMNTKGSSSKKRRVSEISLSNSDFSSQEQSKRNRKSYKSKRTKISSESVDKSNFINEINAEDLEELRTVYKKCKAVIKKIETKYGHLLDSEGTDEPGKHYKNENECECTYNTKILYDEDGKEVMVDNEPCEKDLCPKRLKPVQSEPNLKIEYHEDHTELPENLDELSNMLQNTEMEITMRNKLVNRARKLKFEYSNNIKFNKHILVDKLKTNPDEVLDFKGTNLFSLSGYS